MAPMPPAGEPCPVPSKAEALTVQHYRPGVPVTGWLGPLTCALSFAHSDPAKPPQGCFWAPCPATEQVALPAGLGHSREAAVQGALPSWAIFLGELRAWH